MATKFDVQYRNSVHQVRSKLESFAVRQWNGLGSWRDDDYERLVKTLVPRIDAGQQQIANLTDAYIRRLAVAEFGSIRAGVVADASTEALRGVTAAEVYHRPFASAYTELKDGKSMTTALAAGRDRLSDLVLSGSQLAKTHSAREALDRTRFIGFQRVLTGRENCALCVIASTQRYRQGELLPIHPGCVPGDSVILPVTSGSAKLADFAWGEVEAISRRLFEGELIEFVTASGDEVRVTPNHPVLADKGWVPAHLLREGDSVFRAGESQRVVGCGPDVDERPALAQDVFDAARMAFPLVRVPLATEDFHADGADGEVEIVYTNGNFPTPGGAERAERLSELGFVHAHGGRLALDGGSTLSALIPGGFAPLGGGVGGGSLGGNLFRGHLGGSGDTGFTAAPDLDAFVREDGSYGAAINPISGGNLVFGDEFVDVEVGDLSDGQDVGGASDPTRFDAPASEFSIESSDVYASQGRALRERLAGEVEFDRIVKLRRVSFSGHVFNLHTREGWYSSNNHIVSNCDCDVKPLHGEFDVQVIKPELLESTYDTIAGKLEHVEVWRDARDLGLGKVDAKDRPISDFTDLIMSREHGELGPVLTWRSQRFTSAADIAALA